jgi:hypothetical protein
VCAWIPSGPRSVVEPRLATVAQAIAEFNGEV